MSRSPYLPLRHIDAESTDAMDWSAVHPKGLGDRAVGDVALDVQSAASKAPRGASAQLGNISKVIFAALLALIFTRIPVGAQPSEALGGGPSFTCSPPSSFAHKVVCDDPALMKEDRELAARWRLELQHDASGAAHRNGPRLTQALDRCRSSECVQAWYRAREHDAVLGIRR